MFQSNFTLPRDFDAAAGAGAIAVPTSPTAVTTGDTELGELSVTNTTGSTVTLTLTNTAGTNIMDVLNVAANAPVVISWTPPLKTLGLKWSAGGAGLAGTVTGRKTTGWALDTGSTFCNNVTS